MEMTGEQLIPAPQQDTWLALNDPEVLKTCVAGCESMERVADNEYAVQMTARVGPVSAKFKGKLVLSDIRAPDSYALAFEGQGGVAGFGKGSAKVSLAPEAGGTKLSYAVQATVGGKLAQIGSRLIDAAAKKMADDFFGAFNEKMTTLHAPADAAGAHAAGAVPRDAALPTLSNTAIAWFAAAALVVVGAVLVFWLS